MINYSMNVIDRIKGGRSKKKKRNDLDTYNREMLTNNLLTHFENIATSIFVYPEFDDFISEEIERKIYGSGGATVLFKDKDGVVKVMNFTATGLNEYGLPVKVRAFSTNGKEHWDLTVDEDCVIIYNNKTRTSPLSYIYLMVEKLVNLEETMDINTNSIKTPFIASADVDSLLAFKNLYRQITNNEPVVYQDKGSQLTREFKLFQTGATFMGKDLNEQYSRYEGRILNYLGLEYLQNEKKERMVVAEVNKNDEYTNLKLASSFLARERAIKKFSEITGEEYSVAINPLIRIVQETNEFYEEEDEGDIYGV